MHVHRVTPFVVPSHSQLHLKYGIAAISAEMPLLVPRYTPKLVRKAFTSNLKQLVPINSEKQGADVPFKSAVPLGGNSTQITIIWSPKREGSPTEYTACSAPTLAIMHKNKQEEDNNVSPLFTATDQNAAVFETRALTPRPLCRPETTPPASYPERAVSTRTQKFTIRHKTSLNVTFARAVRRQVEELRF